MTIRRMVHADIACGMALKAQAGWNQLEADWRRFLDLEPDGCFVAEADGRPVGTVTSIRFGPVAWVAMMLVDAAYRRRGIGRALMTTVLEWLDGRGIPSIRLDATPLGRPLYESLGFQSDATILRYQGNPMVAETDPIADEVDGLSEVFWALDQEATGADRRAFLERLASERPDAARSIGGRASRGFVLGRKGEHADQVGPCIATDSAGAALLESALRRLRGRTAIVDVPQGHAASRAVVEAHGLEVRRELTRMTRGRPVSERLELIWASAGPEVG